MYDPPFLLNEIHHALEEARVQSWDDTREAVGNATKSGYFCSLVGEFLHPLIGKAWPDPSLKKRQITTKLEEKNEAGEWLLDIVWSLGAGSESGPEKGKGTIAEWYGAAQAIVCAVECESDTAGKEFFKDLAKLLVVRAPLKIFLGGLNQGTEKGAHDYMERRLGEVEQFIAKDSARWFVGFWPSPKGDLWEALPKHLEHIYLYERLGAGERGWRLAELRVS